MVEANTTWGMDLLDWGLVYQKRILAASSADVSGTRGVAVASSFVGQDFGLCPVYLVLRTIHIPIKS
jgi:hypothetical protein